MDLELLDPARIGIENFELDARGMPDKLATRGDPPDDGEHEAAERIDVGLFLGLEQLGPEPRLELLDRCARRGDEPELGVDGDIRRLLLVVLVLDVADDLLDQILDGDEPVRAAVLVDDQRHVDARRLHANEQVHGRHGGRHIENRPADLHHRDRPREIDPGEIRLA